MGVYILYIYIPILYVMKPSLLVWGSYLFAAAEQRGNLFCLNSHLPAFSSHLSKQWKLAKDRVKQHSNL